MSARRPADEDHECWFCADCGTRLYHVRRGAYPNRNIKPGTLDDTVALPTNSFWTRSAQPWFDPRGGHAPRNATGELRLDLTAARHRRGRRFPADRIDIDAGTVALAHFPTAYSSPSCDVRSMGPSRTHQLTKLFADITVGWPTFDKEASYMRAASRP